MRTITTLAIAAGVLVAMPSAGQAPADVLNMAAETMGAPRLTSIEYTASGTNYALGQGVSPDERVGPRFTVKSVSVGVDYAAGRRRQEMVRTAGEPTPRGGGGVIVGEQRQVQSATGVAVWLTPHGFVKKALTSNPTVEPQTKNGRRVTTVTFTADGNKIRGTINEQNLVEQIDSWTPHPQFGDMLVEDIFSDYKDFGGVKFPTKIVRQEAGYLTLDLVVSDVRPNAPVAADTGGGGRQGGGGGGGRGGSATTVDPVKVADGVWRMGGFNAQNSVIEFKDFVVVYEASGDDQRSAAVVAKIKELVPGKPIRYVVDSHHHADHSGGLRGYAAEGATIVTHENYRKFYEKTFSAPRTLSPDLLARSGKKAKFEYVRGKRVISDGARALEVYDLPNNDHANGLLMAYLPKEKLLFESDLYSPGYAAGDPDLGYPHPWNVQLHANIQRLKLDVERIVPTHGPVSPISDLQQRVAKTASK